MRTNQTQQDASQLRTPANVEENRKSFVLARSEASLSNGLHARAWRSVLCTSDTCDPHLCPITLICDRVGGSGHKNYCWHILSEPVRMKGEMNQKHLSSQLDVTADQTSEYYTSLVQVCLDPTRDMSCSVSSKAQGYIDIQT